MRRLIALAICLATVPAGQATAADARRVLPAGTIIRVTPVTEISSKRLHRDDPVAFQVAESIYRDDTILLARGTPVRGVVSWRARRNFFGKRAKFDVTFRSVTLGGREWALAGRARRVSTRNEGAFGDMLVSRPPHAVMRPGEAFTATLAEAIRLP